MNGQCLNGAVEFEIHGPLPKISRYVGSRTAWDVSLGPGAQFETMPAREEFIALPHGGGDASKPKG